MKIDPHLFEAPLDMMEDDDELDFEFDHLPKELRDPDWWSDAGGEERISVRRKIERRRERDALYSELDDFVK